MGITVPVHDPIQTAKRALSVVISADKNERSLRRQK